MQGYWQIHISEHLPEYLSVAHISKIYQCKFIDVHSLAQFIDVRFRKRKVRAKRKKLINT